jgi:UDP-GlcNAc:undecaprenyl-phosphate GlcNAc-1-phosphate transferase
LLAFALLALLAFAQSFLVAAVITPWAGALGRRVGMMDRPGAARKLHRRPTPRSGGVAVFVAFWGCLALNILLARWIVPELGFLPESVRVLAGNIGLRGGQLAAIALGATIIFALGVLDDLHDLPAGLRLGVQVLAVVPLLMEGVVIRMFLPPVFGMAVTILWVVLLTNSFNFLDNMNGLTSGVAAIVAAVMVLQSGLSDEYYLMLVFALVAGSAAGFLVHNFPKGSIFLGDSGSTHLGFLLASLMILVTYYREGTPTALPILMPLIVLGVPLFDTLSVMWIRWREGRPLMVGDRCHVSHRLVDLGMTRVEAVVFLYGATLCVGLAAVALRPLDWRFGLVQAAVIVLLFLGLYFMERVSRRRHPSTTSHSPSREDRSP